MGFISGIIDELDKTGQVSDEQRELVDRLSDLAQSKADFYEATIKSSLINAGKGDDLTIPVESILDSTVQVHAYSSSNSNTIGDTVKDAVSSFCSGSSGSVIDGVSKLLSGTLNIFLGEGSAGEDHVADYYVMVEGISIVRLDVMAWSRTVEAKSIRGYMEKVTAFVGVKSAVDVSKLRFNTFLAIYGKQLNESGVDPSQIGTELETAQDIYGRFSAGRLLPQPAER